MSETIKTVPRRTVGEWTLYSECDYAEPFVDVTVDATFTSPSGEVYAMPGFYDGEGTWRIRFSPDKAGTWAYRFVSRPADPELAQEGTFEATPNDGRGFLRATPGQAWGFQYESGEPAFLLGDTTYNLFGMAYCGGDVEAFLRRRAEQGFNVFRVRCQVSPFHPPEGYSVWQTRSTWPWGGSEQSPRFDRFNLDYFQTVDEVLRIAEDLGIGFEMIVEAWGFEYPFNDRAIFVREWEELWLRYLIARFDAFGSVYFWTLMNEYEYYPDGDWRYNPIADRWAMRVGRWVKESGPHGHVVSVHNGPQMPPFAERFRIDPGAVDAVMFQVWGSTGAGDGWLAAGIDEQILKSFAGWGGSAVFAEYGYERNPDLSLTFPGFTHCDGNHTRRGAWRGAFCAMGVINGFENTWGPVMNLEDDQEGVAYLQNLKRFFTQVVPFEELGVAPGLVLPGPYERGYRPLALASANRDLVAIYMPAGGAVTLDLPGDRQYNAQWWYDPRTGELSDATPSCVADPPDDKLAFEAPAGVDATGWPLDWVLVLFTM
jgi:hypothetical protein